MQASDIEKEYSQNIGRDIRRVTVFASYSRDNTIPEYVVYYLKELRKVVDAIVFVADNAVYPHEIEKIEPYIVYARCKKHGEYDFGSYKRGFFWAKDNGLLDNAEELIFCNDSCYGPVFPFSEIFDTMKDVKEDFWGMTRSTEIKDHLQSYFLVFKRNVFMSKTFETYVSSFSKEESFYDYVIKYEIPFAETLHNAGFTYTSFNDRQSFYKLPELISNPNCYVVSQLNSHMPLIKKKAYLDEYKPHLQESLENMHEGIESFNPILATIICEDIKRHFEMTKTEDFYCLPTDDKNFCTRFNFRRIVEEKPSPDALSMIEGKSIAVHLHLFYLDLLPEIISHLNNIPCRFDLFVSIPEQQECDADKISTQLHKIEFIGNIKIVRTPNRGRDIAPMLCTFKEDLQKYDFMLHIHTKKSPYGSTLEGWRGFIFDHLLRSREGVTYILQLLADDMGMIAPPDFIFTQDKWNNNIAFAQQVFDATHSNINLKEEVPFVKFPQGTMFWTRMDYLKNFFDYSWTYDSFPAEPLPQDNTITHAMERLLFLWNDNKNLKCCFIYHSYTDIIARAEWEAELSQYAKEALNDRQNAQNLIKTRDRLEEDIRRLVKDADELRADIRKEHTNYLELSNTLQQTWNEVSFLKSKVRRYRNMCKSLFLFSFISLLLIIILLLLSY